MQGYGNLVIAAGTATGNLVQLYPTWAPVGDALPIAPGGTLRRPEGGRVGQVSIQSDGTNGGVIELWDLTGLDVPCDVSSLTAITNTQLLALIARGAAQLVWKQNYAASPSVPAAGSLAFGFMRGLAARNIAASGSASLNIIAEGGYSLRTVPCGFTG